MLIIDSIVKVGHWALYQWAWTSSCISKLLDEDLVEVIHKFLRLLFLGSKWGSPGGPLEASHIYTMNQVKLLLTSFHGYVSVSFLHWILAKQQLDSCGCPSLSY